MARVGRAYEKNPESSAESEAMAKKVGVWPRPPDVVGVPPRRGGLGLTHACVLSVRRPEGEAGLSA